MQASSLKRFSVFASVRKRRRGVALVRADAAGEKANPVICIGEVLWDGLPAQIIARTMLSEQHTRVDRHSFRKPRLRIKGLFLGGAPVNVAQHMCGLGVPTACVSCVGDDTLGEFTAPQVGSLDPSSHVYRPGSRVQGRG
eukprot:8713026-Pyramimonas_sp.AAC.1